jgi:hypothetical protein
MLHIIAWFLVQLPSRIGAAIPFLEYLLSPTGYVIIVRLHMHQLAKEIVKSVDLDRGENLIMDFSRVKTQLYHCT